MMQPLCVGVRGAAALGLVQECWTRQRGEMLWCSPQGWHQDTSTPPTQPFPQTTAGMQDLSQVTLGTARNRQPQIVLPSHGHFYLYTESKPSPGG